MLLGQSTGSILWCAARGVTWGQISRVQYPVMDGADFAQPLDTQIGLVVGPAMDVLMFSSGNMSHEHPH